MLILSSFSETHQFIAPPIVSSRVWTVRIEMEVVLVALEVVLVVLEVVLVVLEVALLPPPPPP